MTNKPRDGILTGVGRLKAVARTFDRSNFGWRGECSGSFLLEETGLEEGVYLGIERSLRSEEVSNSS